MPRNDPTYQPITVDDGWFLGEDQSVQWTISQSSGAVQDLTGFTLQFKLAATKGGSNVLTKTVTSGSPTSGVCTLTTVPGDTAGLSATTYYYTLSRTDSGFNRVLAWGPCVLQGRPL
jgi:hypothetical protein